MNKEFPEQQLGAEEQELNDSLEKGEWVSVENLEEEKRITKEAADNYFKQKDIPCRCCGGKPEQVYYYSSNNRRSNPIHRCTNCGFQLIAKDELGNSEELWVKANEKRNPFFENNNANN